MNLSDKLQDLKKWDNRRPSFPGEHWLALGAGMLVMRSAGKSRSFLGRMAGRALGAALMALGGFVTATDRRFRSKPEDQR